MVTGFGDKGIEQLHRKLTADLQPSSSKVIESAPWNRALEHPNTVIQRVRKELSEIPEDEIVLIGHSYGALIALVAACRQRFLKLLKVVLIDGPLNAHVEVNPAKLAHRIFFKHYENRKQVARECETLLSFDDPQYASKVVSIVTENDKIVPPSAKKLNGNFKNLILESDNKVDELEFPADRGVNITLPQWYGGHRLEPRLLR